MADDTILNAGAGGDTIATDDIAGVKFQRVKIAIGADGVNDGDVASGNPLPVILMPNSGVDSGDVTVNNGTGASSVPVQGAAAIDAASAGNPVYMGGRASAAAPGDVSGDGDAQAVWLTLKGAVNVADGGGTLSIDDGGGAITVDGTVAVTDGGGSLTVDGAVAVTNAGTFATQVDGAALTALQLIDDVVFAEDAAAANGDKGIPWLLVRRDVASSGVSTDGDYGHASMDSNGALRVTLSGASDQVVIGSDAIDAAISTDPVLMAGRGSTATPAAVSADNDVQAIWLTRTGAVNIADAGGSLTVDNGGTFAVQVDGAALTALQLIDDVVFAEDAAAASGDKGITALSVRRDTPATSAGTTGDYATLNTSAEGGLWASLIGSASGGTSVHRTISAATTNATSVKASAGTIHGVYTHNANAANRFVKIYNKASAPTVGTDTPIMTIESPTGGAEHAWIPFVPPVQLSTGIAFAITTGLVDSDTAAVAANEIIVMITYT